MRRLIDAAMGTDLGALTRLIPRIAALAIAHLSIFLLNALALLGGTVSEAGTFDESTARGGYFRSLYTISQDPLT